MTWLDDGRPDRRRLLVAMGATAAGGVAGCLGRFDPDDRGDGGPDDGGDGRGDDDGGRQRYSVDDHPIDEPMAFSDERHCAVCNMRPARFLAWAAQLAHEDATGVFFDTPGCLLAYVVEPEFFDGSAEPLANVWATDFGTGELFDLTNGYLVRETNFDRHDFPMGGSPIPFANREDAVTYVDEYEDLSPDDVITLDAVDYDVAAMYRENRLP